MGLQEHAGRGQGLTLGVIFCAPPFFFFLRQLPPRAWSSPFSARLQSPEILLSLPPQQYWGMHSRIRLGPRAILSPFSLLLPWGTHGDPAWTLILDRTEVPILALSRSHVLLLCIFTPK